MNRLALFALLAAAAFLVVLGSIIIGGRETNDIALAHQRETISHVITQHGLSLARELRVQTLSQHPPGWRFSIPIWQPPPLAPPAAPR